MPIPELRAPLAFAGDKPGPFAASAGRDLRILVDLPASQRQADNSTTSPGRLGVPEPSRLLWSLGQRDDITLHWLADPGQDDQPGAVCLDEPDRGKDHLTFTSTDSDGSSWLRGVDRYSSWEAAAAQSIPADCSPSAWLRDVVATRVAVEMRADVLVTSSRLLVGGAVPSWVAAANPMTAEQALAVIGLYLRGRRQYPMIAPNGLRFGEHLLLWSAARGPAAVGLALGKRARSP